MGIGSPADMATVEAIHNGTEAKKRPSGRRGPGGGTPGRAHPDWSHSSLARIAAARGQWSRAGPEPEPATANALSGAEPGRFRGAWPDRSRPLERPSAPNRPGIRRARPAPRPSKKPISRRWSPINSAKY